MSRGGLVTAFCSQVGQAKVIHAVVAKERGSTITSADCFEEEASCPCERTALQSTGHKVLLLDFKWSAFIAGRATCMLFLLCKLLYGSSHIMGRLRTCRGVVGAELLNPGEPLLLQKELLAELLLLPAELLLLPAELLLLPEQGFRGRLFRGTRSSQQ